MLSYKWDKLSWFAFNKKILISLWAFDLVSSSVWWEAMTNNFNKKIQEGSHVRRWVIHQGEWDQYCFYLFAAIVIVLLIGVHYWVEYHMRNKCIHVTLLIFNFWLAEPLKVVLLATHFICLTPCRAHLWPDPAPPCSWLLQPLHTFRSGFVLVMVLSIGLHLGSPAMSQALDILPWSRMAISNASKMVIFCSRVFSNPALASMSACRASLAMPQMNWTDHDYRWGIWSHNPAPLIAKLSNFEWTHYHFEQSMKMRSGEPWDLTSVWLGPWACQVVCQGLCWKTQHMY